MAAKPTVPIFANAALTPEEIEQATIALASKGFLLGSAFVDKSAALRWVAKEGNVKAVRLLLELGADITSKAGIENDYQWTSLHFAAWQGHCEVIVLLLSRGADMSSEDLDGQTALHIAAYFGKSEAVAILVEWGSDHRWRDKEGYTPLHLAARKGHVGVIRQLHRMGSPVTVRKSNGRTPLHDAAFNGHHEAVLLLYGLGADVHSKDDAGCSPLHLALRRGHSETTRYLISAGGDLEAVNNKGQTSLTAAAQSNLSSPKLVEWCIDHGADVAAIDEAGNSPLHWAIKKGRIEMIKVLVEKGADIEAKNKHNENPLIIAILCGDPLAIGILADREVNLSVKYDKGLTALHFAAGKNLRQEARVLLRKGAGVNSQAIDGSTALYLATKMGHRDMVRVLLVFGGADTEIMDEDGWTALHRAAYRDDMDMVRLLLYHGADPTRTSEINQLPEDLASSSEASSTATYRLLSEARAARTTGTVREITTRLLLVAAYHGNASRLGQLLDQGGNPDSTDCNGRRVLSVAAEEGHYEACRLLLDRGAMCNARDKDGETALWWAARNGHDMAVRELLSIDLEVDLADNSGQTALSAAAQKGHTSIVRILIDYGALVDVETTYGKSALDFAKEGGHLDAVELLLGFNKVQNIDQHQDRDASSSSADRHVPTDGADVLPKHNPEGIQDTGDTDNSDNLSSSENSSESGNDDKENGQAKPTWRQRGFESLKAVATGNAGSIRQLLKVDPILDMTDDSGRTLIGLAAEDGNIPVVTTMLENGASVDFPDRNGRTALWWASRYGFVSVIKILLEKGANVKAVDNRGYSSLSAAIRGDETETVQQLLAAGAIIESEDMQGRTPLLLACKRGDQQVAQILLDHEANVEGSSSSKSTPLCQAVHQGHRGLAELLLKRGASMKPETERSRSPLFIAAVQGYDSIIELLIHHGAELDSCSSEGQTALFAAAKHGHSTTVTALTQAGARVDLKDHNNRTALSHAKECASEAAIRILYAASTSQSPAQGTWSRAMEDYFAFRQPYKYEPLPGEGFIRLIELQPGKPGDRLSLELFFSNLKQNPTYEALSYEWGESRGTVPVNCNDGHLFITSNLGMALGRIRSRTAPRILWIDAICVDQSNILERGQQVAMMAKIFEQAATVLMWIGESRRDTKAAFESIPVFASLLPDTEYREFDDINSPDTDIGKHVRVVLANAIDGPAGDGMNEIYHRSYFTRAWIFQEIILSGNRGRVVCGSFECEWYDLRAALHTFHQCTTVLGQSIMNYAIYHILYKTVSYNNNGWLTLGSLFKTMAQLCSQDPRDKVYAAIGIPEATKLDVLADYSLSIQEVYINATRHIIREEQDLGIWPVITRERLKTIPNLPSWVPDWTVEQNANEEYLQGTYVHDVRVYTAHNVDDLIIGDPSTTETTLMVNGYVMDRIVVGQSSLDDEDVYDTVIKPVVKFIARMGKGIFDVSMGPCKTPHLTALWEALISSSSSKSTTVHELMVYSAWKIYFDEDIPATAKQMPDDIWQGVQEWDRLSKTEGDFDNEIRETIFSEARTQCDLIYTEKGRFALTNLHAGEAGLVLSIIGGAEDITLLREQGSEDERWYQYVDVVHYQELDRSSFEKLEDIDKSARVERLEIR